jgi:hypothetical protein
VVPVEDFSKLPQLPGLEVLVTKFGGHCGFLKNWKLESLAEDLLLERMLRATATIEASSPLLAT